MMKNAEMMPMDITMSDGTKVMMNGMVIMKDGKMDNKMKGM